MTPRASKNSKPSRITLAMIRRSLFSAVISDALDALGYPNQSPRIALKPMTGVLRMAGRCRTTLWADMFHSDPRPYEVELAAVDSCRPDDVLISAAGGSMRSGIWGELLSTAARSRGCVGAIVDGAIRDVDRMTRMNFPVWARDTCIYDSLNRQRAIDMDVPVEIAGVRVSSGDLVVADVDGIVFVPQEVEQQALQNAWTKVHAENIVRESIRKGMKARDAYAKYGVL